MQTMHSLEGRLHLGLSISLAVLIGAAWWLGHNALHRSTEAYVLSRLQHDAEALVGSLRKVPAQQAASSLNTGMLIYNQPFSGHYYKLLTTDRVYRSPSLEDQDIAVAPQKMGSVRDWKADGPKGQQLLVRAAGYRLDDRPATLAVAEDLTPLVAVLKDFERLFAVLAVVGLGLMVLIQRLILRQGFERLRPVCQDIERLERGTARQLTETVPAEILPLVRKLNGLIRVYNKRLERSRNAAGNLAHALKGPLNLMVQQLERRGDQLDGDARGLCRQQVERVRALVERELKRARIAGGGSPGTLFDPTVELPVLAELLKRMYRDKGLRLDCHIETTQPLLMDREDLLELTGTLLDNACKWAFSRVHCAITATNGGIRIRIEDDGPGCDETALADLGERGTRLDEAVDGHGLGLSIAREIVDSYDGRLKLGRSDTLGGFSAIIELPIQQMQNAPLKSLASPVAS